jgi:hypothetical protein
MEDEGKISKALVEKNLSRTTYRKEIESDCGEQNENKIARVLVENMSRTTYKKETTVRLVKTKFRSVLVENLSWATYKKGNTSQIGEDLRTNQKLIGVRSRSVRLIQIAIIIILQRQRDEQKCRDKQMSQRQKGNRSVVKWNPVKLQWYSPRGCHWVLVTGY